MICVGELGFMAAPHYAQRMITKAQKKIRLFRKSKGWTQAAMGKLLGVTQTTVGRWEKESLPEGENLRALAALMGISVDELLSDEDAPSSARPATTIQLPVSIPNETSLIAMFSGILRIIDPLADWRDVPTGLARHFPAAFQAIVGGQTGNDPEGRSPENPSPPPRPKGLS